MALKKREKLLLAVTVTVVVVGANYLLATPLSRKWTGLERQLKNHQETLAMIKATLQREPGWQEEYDQLRQRVGQTTQQFQATSDVLKKIEEVGAATGIIISNRRPLPAVEKDVYRELPVQCTFEATIESLVKFLHGIQTGAGFMSVETLQISGKPDNPSILRCDIQIRALAGKSERKAS
jgi:Tfp pilus assembly protein PilO